MNSSWTEPTPRILRQFGFLMGGIWAGVFGLILPWVGGRPFPAWPWALAVFFIAPALLYPRALRNVHLLWMRIGHILGAVNSRILLGLVFFLLIVPVGLFKRILDKKNARAYRVVREGADLASGMDKPF